MKFRNWKSVFGCLALAIPLLLTPVSTLGNTDHEILEQIKQGLQRRHDSIKTFKGSLETTH